MPIIRYQPAEFHVDVYDGTGTKPLAGVPVVISYMLDGQSVVVGETTTGPHGYAIYTATITFGGNVTFIATFPGGTYGGVTYDSSQSTFNAQIACGDCVEGSTTYKTCWNGEVIPDQVCNGMTCWQHAEPLECPPMPPMPLDTGMLLVVLGGALLVAGLVMRR